MKDRYLLAMGFVAFLMVFTFSIIAAKPDVKTNLELGLENNVLFGIQNISYAHCVKLDKEIRGNCLNEATAKLINCNIGAEKDNLKLESCKESFNSDKKSCKNSFNNIKGNCALNRKTLFQRLKEII